MESDSPLYLYYITRLVAFEDFSCLDLYFRSEIGLPEGTFMRITEINGKTGNFGEATPKPTSEFLTGPEDLLVSRIISTALPDELHSLTVLCIDPASNKTIATLTLGDAYDSPIYPNRSSAATASPQPASTAALDPNTVLENISLGIADKPQKYSHYNAWLRIYPDRCEVNPRFRYHDPLPEGTVLRIIAIDGIAGLYGEAIIETVQLDNSSISIYSANITMQLPAVATRYTAAAFAPDAEEAIFTVTLTNSESTTSYWSGGNWYAPDGDVYYPMNTQTPFGYNPAPTVYSPTYNYNNWNNGYSNPSSGNVWGW